MWKASEKLPEDTDASLRPMRGFETVLKQEEVVHSVKTKRCMNTYVLYLSNNESMFVVHQPLVLAKNLLHGQLYLTETSMDHQVLYSFKSLYLLIYVARGKEGKYHLSIIKDSFACK